MRFNSTVIYYQNKTSNFILNKSSNKIQCTVGVNYYKPMVINNILQVLKIKRFLVGYLRNWVSPVK